MSTPLPPWTRQNSFQQGPHQRVVDRVNELGNVTAPGGGQVLRTPYGTGVVPPNALPTPPQVVRFQVTTVEIGGLNTNYLLAKMYGSDGTTLVGNDVPILRRGAHFVGQDILAARLPNGISVYANDHTLYPQTSGPPTGSYSGKIEWEEIRGLQTVLCYHFVPFAGEGSAYTSHGGWYDAQIVYDQMTMPSSSADPAATWGATDQPCVFFNWIEYGGGSKFHGSGGNYALGVIVGYTATTPPVPIVYAVGGLPANFGTAHTLTAPWNTGVDNAGSNITVVTDVTLTINFAAQTFVLTKHTQTLTWNGYGWIYDKTAQT